MKKLHKHKRNDRHVLQTRDTFTLCKHKTRDTFTLCKHKITNDLDSKIAKEWTCFSCASIELPFHRVRDELNISVERDANCANEHLEKLDELKKHKYLSSKYPISLNYIRRVSIHDEPNKF